MSPYSEVKLKQVIHPHDMDDVLFDLLADEDGLVGVNQFWVVS